MLLIIDNYDSFTYNLVHYFEALDAMIQVYRHDALSVDDIAQLRPDGIVISPGPCTPNEAGISLAAIARFKDKLPILGICLGHQVIAQYFGADIVRGTAPVHGKVSRITHDGKDLFKGLASPLDVTRYHSLVVDGNSLPDALRVTATSSDGAIMAIRHRTLPIFGLQFHPEALLTTGGKTMLANFMTIVKGDAHVHRANR